LGEGYGSGGGGGGDVELAGREEVVDALLELN
jgi:hypothetical protein